jgi:ABC-type enterochelin transport system, permease component
MLISRLPLGSALMVPLVGIMLGGIFDAVTSFLAYRFDLLQSLGAFGSGDFSIVLRGRYEFLWVIAGLVAAAYATAARFTILGMGEAVAVGWASTTGASWSSVSSSSRWSRPPSW